MTMMMTMESFVSSIELMKLAVLRSSAVEPASAEYYQLLLHYQGILPNGLNLIATVGKMTPVLIVSISKTEVNALVMLSIILFTIGLPKKILWQ